MYLIKYPLRYHIAQNSVANMGTLKPKETGLLRYNQDESII